MASALTRFVPSGRPPVEISNVCGPLGHGILSPKLHEVRIRRERAPLSEARYSWMPELSLAETTSAWTPLFQPPLRSVPPARVTAGGLGSARVTLAARR